MDISSIITQSVFGIMAVGLVILVIIVVWTISNNVVPPITGDDPRFVADRRGGVRRRDADPWDVRCTRGGVSQDNHVRLNTWECVVDDVPFIAGRFFMVGAHIAISPIEIQNRKRELGGMRGLYPTGTTALGEGWPPVHVFGVADERAQGILARAEVREALSGLVSSPDFVLLHFDGARRFTVELRRSSMLSADEVEDRMKRVEVVAAAIVPACREVPGGPSPHRRGTVGADGQPVSTGLPLS